MLNGFVIPSTKPLTGPMKEIYLLTNRMKAQELRGVPQTFAEIRR
jgi:hypothetical protein